LCFQNQFFNILLIKMNYKIIKDELQHIISGTSGFSYDASIQAITSFLRTSEKTSQTIKGKHQNKEKETANLIDFANKNGIWYKDINPINYISEGAEQKVFMKDPQTVVKLNDAIYYASWEDYFHNLLLHNYFFADTAYRFLGFYLQNNILYAAVAQNYVYSDSQTTLEHVRIFLESNGFINKKNHDYYHPELGIILEDLHDENVLTNKSVLYFIDTVFFIKPEVFWS
jgi:hypothetical protein